MIGMVGRQYTYTGGVDNLPKAVAECMELFRKVEGYPPTFVELRDDEYDPSIHKLPLRVFVLHATIASHTMIMYPAGNSERHPVILKVKRTPWL